MANKPWEFNREKAVLLVIDMQNDFVRDGATMAVPMAREFLPNMKRIVKTCRDNQIPVIYTRHVLYDQFMVSPLEAAYQPVLKSKGMRDQTSGIDIVEELAPLPEEIIISKHRYYAFYNTPLETVINHIRGMNQVDTVIIIGTVTSICCESTARSAFMRDYKVAFISDANSGLDEQSHQATLAMIGKVFGRVFKTEEIVEEIDVRKESFSNNQH